MTHTSQIHDSETVWLMKERTEKENIFRDPNVAYMTDQIGPLRKTEKTEKS